MQQLLAIGRSLEKCAIELQILIWLELNCTFISFSFFFFLFFILIYIFFRIASERSQLRKYCFQNYIKSAVVEQVSISQIKFFFLFSLLLLYFISLANIRMIFTNNQLLQILRKMKYIMKFIDTL